jgi:cellulose biosynthesis protein BcsQ
MMEVEVALAASARDWPDRIHRFLADHGGARVRAQVLTPEDALAEDYQVLIIDDVCSFLTPRLVDTVQRRRRQVLGVFDPADSPDAKERLRECGVDQVIESDASADEFVVALRALVVLAPETPSDIAPVAEVRPLRDVIAVGAPPGGCGATEVAISLALHLTRFGPTVLIDLDETAPAIAQRLALAMLPNLRSAIDAVTHRNESLEAALQSIGRLDVLTGLSSDRDWIEIRAHEVREVLDELIARYRFAVVNVGSQLGEVAHGSGGRFAISRTGIGMVDQILMISLPSPVSVSRLASWYLQARDLNPSAVATVVVNRAPRSKYRRAELKQEIERATGVRDIGFLPEDPQLRSASWSGEQVSGGRFYRASKRLARDLVTR